MAKRSIAASTCQVLQMYVRLLETDENGYGRCCSCDKVLQWGEGQGGHFHPKGRNYNAAAFEEENIHLQCSSCNLYQGGNPSGYLDYMNREYGYWDDKEKKFLNPTVDHINKLAYQYLDIEEIKKLKQIYRQKCKDRAKQKNFEVKIP